MSVTLNLRQRRMSDKGHDGVKQSEKWVLTSYLKDDSELESHALCCRQFQIKVAQLLKVHDLTIVLCTGSSNNPAPKAQNSQGGECGACIVSRASKHNGRMVFWTLNVQYTIFHSTRSQ